MNEVVIVEAVRTPVGKRNGLLSDIRADELLAKVLREIVDRVSLDPSQVDDVIAGCVSQVGEQAGDVARVAALIAGFPKEVPGVTIDRQCGSSQQALHFASQAIASGDMDIVIAGGVESMSRVPMFSNMKGSEYSDKLTDRYEIINQGLSAERIADHWKLSRRDLDEYAASSHERALRAREEERFDKEIMAVEAKDKQGLPIMMQHDEGPRPGTTADTLAELKPVFNEHGVITAGNASQISDGASAVLLMSHNKAEELGLQPRCRVVARSVVGSDPTFMLTGPVPATHKVLQKAGLNLADIDLFEVNEAFAPVPLFWLKETGAERTKLNVNGGAIALGHPLGATGTKLLTTLVHELERSKGRYGLQAVCEGMGMANATIIERLEG
ncbi:acetyl-CoA acetyltransferase [Halobacillus andaensis]|uniref:Acetyl-CoA acetyltransferase n=1 Tax=Halobacillus andaensis TaxID=1176239 RepID=A0A917B3S2_HALAA|nr:thiolase family protein [Halobacillus andaensis]MBP2004683.1 acetyl-CoA C-acetyltransferase [Halobacillus andaensis]GGF19770.1 acetyl-CoA acetyltransferase [Halobacillus andaensis]